MGECANLTTKQLYDLGVEHYKGTNGRAVNYEEAVKYFRAAAERNDKNAQFYMGFCCANGRGLPTDIQEAIRWYTLAAEQNLRNAQYNLALIYYKGKEGIKTDYSQAVKWFRAAADNGHAAAQYYLAICYTHARGVEQDYEQAAQWYKKAAKQNHLDSQFNLAWCYSKAQGVSLDYERSIYWYTKAAEAGHQKAQYNLGWCYEVGQGVEKDIDTAMKWYEESAKNGHTSAQYNLGIIHYYGKYGLPVNYETAVAHFHAAADNGHAAAQYYLAICYTHAKGVEQDYGQAAQWYEKAAEQNHLESQFNLGWCYSRGQGVPVNHNQSIRWYTKAAQAGHKGACTNLAWCYEIGRGVEKNIPLAIEWYTKAAEAGGDYAQNTLGMIYYYGKYDIPIDHHKAAEFFLAAAENGHANAQYHIACCYEDGLGIEQNHTEAFRWYLASANRENESAYYAIGNCYLNGIGTQKDLDEAKKWLRMAAENDDENALYALALLEQEQKTADSKQVEQLLEQAALLGHETAEETLNQLKPASATEISKPHFVFTSHEQSKTDNHISIHFSVFSDAYEQQALTHSRRIKAADSFTDEEYSDLFDNTDGMHLTIKLHSDDIELLEDTAELYWNNDYRSYNFMGYIPKNYSKRQAVVWAMIYEGEILRRKQKALIKIAETPTEAKDTAAAKTGFVSYCSEDINRVLDIVRGLRTNNPELDLFMDVIKLRSGDKWEDRLIVEIDKCDEFYLFWSPNAAKSFWVEKEYTHAVNTKKDSAIKPMSLVPPKKCPPPEKLKHLCFDDLTLRLRNFEDNI